MNSVLRGNNPASNDSNNPFSSRTIPQGYDSFYDDEQALRMLELLKGTDYYDQALNSPYWTYKWVNDGILDGSIFKPNSNSERATAGARTALYDDLRRLLEASTKYEQAKPSTQVSLDKMAGINSDLLGVQGAGEAPDVNNPDVPYNPADYMSNEFDSVFSNLGNIAMNAINLYFGIKNGRLSSSSLALDNVNKAKDVAVGIVDAFEGNSGDPYSGDIPPALKADYSFIPKRILKKIKPYMEEYSSSWPRQQKRQEHYNAGNKNYEENSRIMSSVFSEGNPAVSDGYVNKFMYQYNKHVAQLADEELTYKSKVMTYQLDYQKYYTARQKATDEKDRAYYTNEMARISKELADLNYNHKKSISDSLIEFNKRLIGNPKEFSNFGLAWRIALLNSMNGTEGLSVGDALSGIGDVAGSVGKLF